MDGREDHDHLPINDLDFCIIFRRWSGVDFDNFYSHWVNHL